MDELITQVAQRAGITNEQAKIAVETAVEYAKGHLPEPLYAQVESYLKTGQFDMNQLGGLLGGLGGMFGGKQ
jgi:nucleoid DNA-binding protein